jgi:hypothetical protein
VRSYLLGLLKPWRLVTLAFGIAVLLYGAAVEQAPDWDYGVSWLMALVAYTTAPLAIRLLCSLEWKQALLAVALVWFGADGCYAIYWHFVNPRALELMRDANAPASTLLFLLAGVIWRQREAPLQPA